jgi:SAM-dependent methyltransferase
MIKEIIPLSIRKSLGNWWNARQNHKRHKALLNELSGHGIFCNICEWEGRAFADDIWHPETVCPNCRSQVRHRMLAAIFDGQSNLPGLDQNSLLAGKNILHFALERQLRERIQKIAGRYTTADYDRGDCDLKLNMSAMPELDDSQFDIIIACDVLEHVPDDLAAMRELHRILKPGGTAILTVPQKDSPSSTDEDSSVTDPTERERRFGQKDHVRMYGDDFPERLTRSGFKVEIISAGSFDGETLNRHTLHPPVSNSNPLATNQRRIYIAKKARV